MKLNLKEAIASSRLKSIGKKLRALGRRDRTVKPIVDKLEAGQMPTRQEIMRLKGDPQDEVVMAFAEVIGPSQTMKAIGMSVDEAKKLEKDKDDPCWDGYVQLGTKKKNGKEVPNCVPKESVKESIKNYLMSESVRVDDQRFVRAHGKKPKGRGSWAFTTKEFDDPKDKDIFRAPMFTDYKKAKDLAKKWAKKQGVGVGGVVYTMESVELDESVSPRDISVGDNIQFTHPRTKKRVMGRVMKKPLPTMLTVQWSGGKIDLDATKFGASGPKIELVKENISENIH